VAAVAIVSLLCPAASAQAATVTVTSASGAGSGSLRAAVAEADGGDTIAFAASLEGQTITLTGGAIEIEKSLTIEGPGASHLAIDGGRTGQIFFLADGDLSVSGLTLADGAAPKEGGAIDNDGAGSLTVSHSTFVGDTAGGAGGSADESDQGFGGAIFIGRSAGPTSVSDSVFREDSAGGAGGSGEESGLGSGGAIWDGGEGALTVTRSTFIENAAGGDGGEGTVSGGGAGGAIQKSGGLSLTVSASVFTDNTAGGIGGGENDSGEGRGAAIYVSQVSATATALTVNDSTFDGNVAGGAGGDGRASGNGYGGAIAHYAEGSLTVTGSTFTANSAGGDGGAGRAGFLVDGGSGSGEGGAIDVGEHAGSTHISESAFDENRAGGDGGSGNQSGRGEGGAVLADGAGGLTIDKSTFTENRGGGRRGVGLGSGSSVGGAVNGFGALTVTESSFDGNAAAGEGGAGEGALGRGGAIWNFGNVASLSVSASTFAGNSAGGQGEEGQGGAIYADTVSGRPTSISDSTLVGNTAGGGGGVGDGGAIEFSGPVSATVASATIDENEVGGVGVGAGIGGAGEVTAEATIISGNVGATNCDVPVVSSSYSLEGPTVGDTSCGFDLPSADPLLEPLADNGGPTETQALPHASPAVDAVPVSKCPTTVDQRGEPRPDNGKGVCDVGAFEFQDPPIAPTVTSAATATFQVGSPASFAVTASGVPAPALSLSGPLPAGIVFTDAGGGNASLSGTPTAGTGGTYPVTFRASNGTLPDSEQSFTLEVQAPPSVTIAAPADAATFTQGQAIAAQYSCTEGTEGTGITSCLDGDGSPSGASLDTATIGPHTFTVIATSKDGLTGRASITYNVVAAPIPTGPARPAVCKVPKLKGKRLKAAKKQLSAAHCKVGKVKKKKGVAAKSRKVLGQSPKPGKVLAAGSKVSISLG
jgi:PASTA domain/Putative Ig domain